MKEQRISFETAKLAKEKGFNEKSNHLYCIGYASLKEDKQLKTNYVYDDNGTIMGTTLRTVDKSQPHLALAPTQSLLQKWLREKHGLQIFLIPTVKESYIFYIKINFADLPVNVQDVENINVFKTYEQTLEKGLQKALEQI